MAQVRASVDQRRKPALLDARSVRLLQAAILHAEQDGVEIGPGARFSADFGIVSQSPGRKILETVGDVVTTVDGPEIADPERQSTPRAVVDVGRHESALPRDLSQRLVKAPQ